MAVDIVVTSNEEGGGPVLTAGLDQTQDPPDLRPESRQCWQSWS